MGNLDMFSAVICGPGRVAFVETSVPEPGPGQIRVKLQGCGICSSSLPLWEGREWFEYPRDCGEPGHEGWGIVDAIGCGSTENLHIGDRVAMVSYRALAQYDIAQSDAVVQIPRTLDSLPFPGEALGCAMNIFARSDIQPGDSVLIVGIGFLGALLCRLASNVSAQVLAVSRRRSSLEFARRSGAVHVISMESSSQCIEKILGLTDGRGCDRVIEAAGTQQTLDVASASVATGGRLVIAGYHQGNRQVNMQQWNWRGIDVVNAHERNVQKTAAGMQAAVDEIMKGTLEPSCLYTHRFRLDELADALTITRVRPEGFMKALITL